MAEDCKMHAVVVGAGVIGINCAIALQDKGFRVTVIDARPAGTATSAGNAGCIATSEIFPISMPGLIWSVPRMLFDSNGPLSIRWAMFPRLLPWLVRFLWAGRKRVAERITEELATLLKRCQRDHDAILTAAGATDLIRRQGFLYVYESDAAFQKSKWEWERRHAYGIDFKTLTPDELRSLEPSLSSHFRHGVLVPNATHTVDPHQLVARLSQFFEQRGGAIRRANVVDFQFVGDAPRTAVLSDKSGIDFDRVVIAAGAWSKPLCQRLGFNVPLDTERGYNTTLPNPMVQLSCPVCVVEHSLVLTPMEMGLRIGGAVELAGLKAKPNYERARVLLAHGHKAVPGLDDNGGIAWMGFRPSLPDSKPIISQSRKHPAVLFAFGHGHLGLTQAATTGRLIAQLAANQATDIDVRPFSIYRF